MLKLCALSQFRFAISVILSCANIAVGDDTGVPVPKVSPHQFKGVASCASSNCHGGVAPRNATAVLQNEYVTWSKHDKHSKAWQSLVTAEGKRIGAHLGISNPEREPWCLRCHSTFVADPLLVAPEFRAEDGVGCESCHGAAGGYLREHTSAKSTHQNNVALGLVDLSDLKVRANNCVTCHYGSENADVTHRLMGAGHPRMSFELDTYTALEPMHWRIDADYRERKENYSPARAWVAGQVALAHAMLNRYGVEKRSRVHSGPELTLLSCYSCHHSLTAKQWKVREYAGRPGELRLNTATFFVLQRTMAAFSQEQAQPLREALTNLEDKARAGDLASGAPALQAAVDQAQIYLSKQSFNTAQIRAVIRSLLQGGAARTLIQYEDADQITMAISSLLTELKGQGGAYKAQMKALYDALRHPSEFDAQVFIQASNKFLAVV